MERAHAMLEDLRSINQVYRNAGGVFGSRFSTLLTPSAPVPQKIECNAPVGERRFIRRKDGQVIGEYMYVNTVGTKAIDVQPLTEFIHLNQIAMDPLTGVDDDDDSSSVTSTGDMDEVVYAAGGYLELDRSVITNVSRPRQKSKRLMVFANVGDRIYEVFKKEKEANGGTTAISELKTKDPWLALKNTLDWTRPSILFVQHPRKNDDLDYLGAFSDLCAQFGLQTHKQSATKLIEVYLVDEGLVTAGEFLAKNDTNVAEMFLGLIDLQDGAKCLLAGLMTRNEGAQVVKEDLRQYVESAQSSEIRAFDLDKGCVVWMGDFGRTGRNVVVDSPDFEYPTEARGVPDQSVNILTQAIESIPRYVVQTPLTLSSSRPVFMDLPLKSITTEGREEDAEAVPTPETSIVHGALNREVHAVLNFVQNLQSTPIYILDSDFFIQKSSAFTFGGQLERGCVISTADIEDSRVNQKGTFDPDLLNQLAPIYDDQHIAILLLDQTTVGKVSSPTADDGMCSVRLDGDSDGKTVVCDANTAILTYMYYVLRDTGKNVHFLMKDNKIETAPQISKQAAKETFDTLTKIMVSNAAVQLKTNF